MIGQTAGFFSQFIAAMDVASAVRTNRMPSKAALDTLGVDQKRMRSIIR